MEFENEKVVLGPKQGIAVSPGTPHRLHEPRAVATSPSSSSPRP